MGPNLLYIIQLNFSDLRKFEPENAGRTTKPMWSGLNAEGFVRGFGQVQNRFSRLRDPLIRKEFKDERTERTYVNAFRRLKVVLHREPLPKSFFKCRHVFSRLISDGNFVVRVELGFEVKITKDKTLDRDAIEKLNEYIFGSVLEIYDRVNSKATNRKLISNRKLKDSISLLQDRILSKTTQHTADSQLSMNPNAISFTSAASYFDYGNKNDEDLAVVLTKQSEVALLSHGNIEGYFWEQYIEEISLSTWLVCGNVNTSTSVLRRIRLHVLRLYAETLILEYVLSAISSGYVTYKQQGINKTECNAIIEKMIDRLTDTSKLLSNDIGSFDYSKHANASALSDVVEKIVQSHSLLFSEFSDNYKKQKETFLSFARTLPVSETSPRHILILGANPANTVRLRLDFERRAIDEELQRSDYRDKFRILHVSAVEPSDVLRSAIKYKPSILHFSGHGN